MVTLKPRRATAIIEEINPRQIVLAENDGKTLFWNARTTIDDEAMHQLYVSITTTGLLEEIVVRELPGSSLFQIICGERRQRCIWKAMEDNVPCYSLREGVIKSALDVYGKHTYKVLRNCTDRDAAEFSIAENLARKNLTEWELMEYCRELADRKVNGVPVYERAEICRIIKRSPTWVSQTMSLYDLPKEVHHMLANDIMPRTVALNLLKCNKESVLQVVTKALQLATEDVEVARERADEEVARLEANLKEAQLTVTATEVLGTQTEKVKAKKLKSDLDRTLNDAINRQRTARNRMPRLSADSVSRSTDLLEARTGKSTGMSQKSIRFEIQTLERAIESGSVTDPDSDVEFNERDISLVLLGLKMAIGSVNERNVTKALQAYYESEDSKPLAAA